MVIVLMGPMGCGKTTVGRLLSARLGWRFEDADDFHPPGNVAKMKSGVPLDDRDRLPWLQSLRDMIDQAVENGEDMILACSALKKKYRVSLGVNQESVVSAYLKGSPELLGERIAARTHQYMNKDLLTSQLRTLEEPVDGLIVSIASNPEAAVEDIVQGISRMTIRREHNK